MHGGSLNPNPLNFVPKNLQIRPAEYPGMFEPQEPNYSDYNPSYPKYPRHSRPNIMVFPIILPPISYLNPDNPSKKPAVETATKKPGKDVNQPPDNEEDYEYEYED